MAKSKTTNKKLSWFKQCTFISPTEEGHTVQTAWVPEKFAKVGRKVYFGKKTKTPERIWEVTVAGDKRISSDYLAEHERDYLTQREASDI
jgi:hypothetical protein